MKRLLIALLVAGLAVSALAATKTLTGKKPFYSLTYDSAKWTPGDASKTSTAGSGRRASARGSGWASASTAAA